MQNPDLDSLTGLHAHRFALAELERMCRDAARDGGGFGVLYFDTDNFKSLNDAHGHNAGDAWLRALALTIGKAATGNFVARFGGDEFFVFAPGATPDAALALAERIRARVEELRVEHEGTTLGPVTVSGGVACWPDDGQSALELLGEAELGLIIAKNRGKNIVLPARNPWRRDAPPY